MRKVGIIISFVLTVFQLSAQEGFKLGVQAGLPLNEFNDAVSVVLGADASYMYPLGEVVDIGPAVGYIHGFAEKYQSTIPLSDLEPVQFLPLSAGVRFWTSNSFSFGGNAGWAMGINDGNDGGVYYRPTIAYLTSSSSEVNLSYTNINLDQAKWTTITLGLVYNFEPKYRTRR
ncbi:outer membrane beta-barrel protein [Maribacter sp. MAR_2009_72]|uniref:outer membrane beta-barrel protein n=1 Tax=Maribacter sp. MAR_2009_72 TaxID=1250050 RepID=UPI00119B84E7|nr:outer membrane beta-barrel protein [Maribacter sp. MAR_2009_72]TVZ15014.1 hypothetical protein JM81_1233 [Maribacter sp. MAR_2009_72]